MGFVICKPSVLGLFGSDNCCMYFQYIPSQYRKASGRNTKLERIGFVVVNAISNSHCYYTIPMYLVLYGHSVGELQLCLALTSEKHFDVSISFKC